ncbi:MAG: TlpA disulfide reductase family protein [Bacillota bacterium]|nr:TlpA disulfide reductase family protein [Bacillota bacterium]
MKKKYAIISTILITLALLAFSACGQTSSEGAGESAFGEFSAQTLDGTPVDQSIFAEKSLTMVNVWGTYCSPCIKEMPDLGEISREYADKDFRIIGIPVDVAGSNGEPIDYAVETANEIIADTSADYMHLIPSAELFNNRISEIAAIPETIFVDSQGNQVGESYIGSRSKEAWIEIIDQLMQEIE